MFLNRRKLEDSLLVISNHDVLDYLQRAVSHLDAILDLKLLMENKIRTLTLYQLLDLTEDLFIGPT